MLFLCEIVLVHVDVLQKFTVDIVFLFTRTLVAVTCTWVVHGMVYSVSNLSGVVVGMTSVNKHYICGYMA